MRTYAPWDVFRFVKMKLKKTDIILIAILAVATAAAFIIVALTATGGAYVTVAVDGNITARYPLDTDITVRIGTEECGNTLVIKNGTASITDASCPDRLCENQGAVSYNGQCIVCLPNKTVITVVSDKNSHNDFLQ